MLFLNDYAKTINIGIGRLFMNHDYYTLKNQKLKFSSFDFGIL